ncbi:MAG: hypothetical protein QOF89_1320 [Acidobacteriota bacterium]|jgi:hypothetical protein|nr:hypothetical protein [Acidobacteriota bacterium]
MRKNLFGLVIVAAALLATLSVAPAGAADLAGNPAAIPALAAPGNCGVPAVALPGQSAKAETCTAAPTAESTVPDFMNPPAARLGYCHCGCSSQRTCRTSADCGGASCDQAISCC